MKMAAIVWGLLHPFLMFPVWNWQERREQKKNGKPPDVVRPHTELPSYDEQMIALFNDEKP